MMLADLLVNELNIRAMDNDITCTIEQLNEIEIKISATNDSLVQNEEHRKKIQFKLKKLELYGKKHVNQQIYCKKTKFI